MHITAIIGPMFSGKTSHADNLLSIYSVINTKSLYITHTADTRYESDSLIDSLINSHSGVRSSHSNNIEYDILKCNNLSEIEWESKLQIYDVIVIDEAQFFDDLEQFVTEHIQSRIALIICGLLSDYNMNRIGYISNILHLCTTIIHTKSICKECIKHRDSSTLSIEKRASFTAIYTKPTSDTTILIGGLNEYYPVCINHHPSIVR